MLYEMKPPDQLANDELRIEIAEFCGWTFRIIPTRNYGLPLTSPFPEKRMWKHPNGNEFEDYQAPNYPQDLNAIWEAEEKLDEIQWKHYSGILTDMFETCSWEVSCFELKPVIHATAKQRAKAFVKTIREVKK